MTPYWTTTGTFQVFTFDVTSDPIAFPMFVSLLTNGVAEPFRIFFQTQASDLEQTIDAPYGPNGIDLGGFAIETIELEVDPSFRVTPRTPLSGSNVGGGWGMRVYGAYVPEPSTALLIGMGLAVLSRRRSVAS
jgi:hypothetical protein